MRAASKETVFSVQSLQVETDSIRVSVEFLLRIKKAARLYGVQ